MNPTRREWSQQSNCRSNPKPFLHERPIKSEYEPICEACPVRDLCLAHAIRNDEMGIWGGLTDKERTKVKLSKDELRRVPLEAVGSVYRRETEVAVAPLQKAKQKIFESRDSFYHQVQLEKSAVATVLSAGLATLLLSLPDIS